MNTKHFLGSALLGSALFAAGCGSTREVEVKGSVTSETAVTSIAMTFYEEKKDGDEATFTEIHRMTLSALGPFEQLVDLEGTKLLVIALDDLNKNGECDAGEPYGESTKEFEADATAVDVAAIAIVPGSDCTENPVLVPKTAE